MVWRQSLNQYTFSLKKLLPYLGTSVFATWSIYSLCARIKGTKVLKYIGEHTMIIFTLHFLSFKLVSLLIILIYDLPIERLAEFYTIEEYSHTLWCYAYAIVGIIVPLLLNESFQRLIVIFKLSKHDE